MRTSISPARTAIFAALAFGVAGAAMAAPSFTPTGPMSLPRQAGAAAALDDGRVLLVGGTKHFSPMPYRAEVYDPATGTFATVGDDIAQRQLPSVVRLQDGHVLVAGGYDQSHNVFHRGAMLFDPASGTFAPTGSMLGERGAATATLLPQGRVLIAGGATWGGWAVATAELYDPDTGTFSATGAMNDDRSTFSATLLPDGRVLVAGGDSPLYLQNVTLATAELYDPETGHWTYTDSMSKPRKWHSATRLADGRVLIAGGGNYNFNTMEYLATAEIYDPATSTFTPTGAMTEARHYASGVLLADGRVLIAGGHGPAGPKATAELYDPATGTFSATDTPLNAMREWPTATRLVDGRVLIAGGSGTDESGAELFEAGGGLSPVTPGPDVPGLPTSPGDMLFRDGFE